jgi:hypothetical protein
VTDIDGRYQGTDGQHRKDIHAWAAARRSSAERVPAARQGSAREQVGDKVILEPMERIEDQPFDAKAFWTEIDALGGGDLFLDGPPADPPPMPDPRKFFDE